MILSLLLGWFVLIMCYDLTYLFLWCLICSAWVGWDRSGRAFYRWSLCAWLDQW